VQQCQVSGEEGFKLSSSSSSSTNSDLAEKADDESDDHNSSPPLSSSEASPIDPDPESPSVHDIHPSQQPSGNNCHYVFISYQFLIINAGQISPMLDSNLSTIFSASISS
jgi:hypothetical protein